MRLFELEHIGCYLDHIGHRVERPREEEIKLVDLTLRIQPLTPALAVALDPEVHTLLFRATDGEPRPKVKSLEFRLTFPPQDLAIVALPEASGAPFVLRHVEIAKIRARTEKDLEGFGLVFRASFGPVSREELEYVCAWHTGERFVTFTATHPELPLEAPPAAAPVLRHHPRTEPAPATEADRLAFESATVIPDHVRTSRAGEVL